MRILKFLMCTITFLAALGCTNVYQIPPSLTPDQRAEISNSPYSQLVIGIDIISCTYSEQYLPEYIVDQFKTLLIKSQLFKEVGLISEMHNPPDIVVNLRSSSHRSMCATGEACAMIMTLGIIPLIGNENIQYAYTIYNPNRSKNLDLEFTYIQKSYFGLSTILMSMSSNWSTFPEDERNYQLFAYELVSRKNEILDLLNGA